MPEKCLYSNAKCRVQNTSSIAMPDSKCQHYNGQCFNVVRKIRMAIHLAIDLLKPLNSMFGYRRRKTQASASGRVTPNLEKDLKIFYNTWSATRD